MNRRASRPGTWAIACLLVLPCCGGDGGATTPSASEATLDGPWRLLVDCSDAVRSCSQTGTLDLRQDGIVKGEFYSSLAFHGSIAVPNSTCPDLRVPNWPVHLEGYFLSHSGFVGQIGEFEEWDCGGSCIGYSTFWIDTAERNRLYGTTKCSFGFVGRAAPPWWSAPCTWVAER